MMISMLLQSLKFLLTIVLYCINTWMHSTTIVYTDIVFPLLKEKAK